MRKKRSWDGIDYREFVSFLWWHKGTDPRYPRTARLEFVYRNKHGWQSKTVIK